MKAQAMMKDEPPCVSLELDPREAQELVSDLERAADALSARMSHEEERTGDRDAWTRLDVLIDVLQKAIARTGQGAQASLPVEADMGTMLAPRKDHPQEAMGTFKGIPKEHVEWALKVYRLTASLSRASENATLERVFDRGEAQAKEFFNRTQNVWNMRVKGGEASAFEVILGVQDARKHKKKGSFREVDRALCTGQTA